MLSPSARLGEEERLRKTPPFLGTYRSILVLILLTSIISAMQTIHAVHASGILSITPSSITPVPQGTMVTVDVRVDGMDQFNGWHIDISTNTKALNGTSIDHSTQSVFPSTTPILNLVDCMNGGTPGANTNCQPGEDGIGIVHVEGIIVGQPPTAPLTGVMFSIRFLAGSLNFTNLHFVNNDLVLGSSHLNPYTLDSVYGTPPVPDFRIFLKDQSLSMTPGSMVNTTVSVSSVNAFSGQVNFTSTVVAAGISVVFTPIDVTLNNSTATAKIMISSALSVSTRAYSVNVTATGSGLVHYALLDLNVERPGDFILGFSPQQLKLPPASSGFTTLTLTSSTRAQVSQEFSGSVSLSLKAPRNHWTNAPVNATLDQISLFLAPGGSNSTTIQVSIPSSPFAYYGLFAYQINVTAVSASNHDLNQTQTLAVIPPPFNLIPTASPSVLRITAGQSGLATLSVTGVNYFSGPLYASSTLSGGTARYNESEVYMDVGGTVSFSVNITIDSRTTPGNYVVLLTAYSGTGIAQSVGETIMVGSNGHSAPLPRKILGVTPVVYLGVLGGFGAIFVVLSVLTYRKGRLDRDDEGWENE
jgi:hypothetical protein